MKLLEFLPERQRYAICSLLLTALAVAITLVGAIARSTIVEPANSPFHRGTPTDVLALATFLSNFAALIAAALAIVSVVLGVVAARKREDAGWWLAAIVVGLLVGAVVGTVPGLYFLVGAIEGLKEAFFGK